MERLDVGSEFVHAPGTSFSRVFRVKRIERDANENMRGATLHEVHVIDVESGEQGYLFATDAEVVPVGTVPDHGATARQLIGQVE